MMMCTLKRHWTAFSLQLFYGPFGAADFYTERVCAATIKLVIIYFCIGYPTVCLANVVHNHSNQIIRTQTQVSELDMKLPSICGSVTLLWWVIDTIAYGFNVYTDGNGLPLV